MAQQYNPSNPSPAQSRYGCGHVIQPSDMIPLGPQLCRDCSWMMLHGIREFIDKQNESCVKEVMTKLNGIRTKYEQACAQRNYERAQVLLGLGENLKAEIKQIREAGAIYEQEWKDRWMKRFGQPTREELDKEYEWEREQYEKEKEEEYIRRTEAGQRPLF